MRAADLKRAKRSDREVNYRWVAAWQVETQVEEQVWAGGYPAMQQARKVADGWLHLRGLTFGDLP